MADGHQIVWCSREPPLHARDLDRRLRRSRFPSTDRTLATQSAGVRSACLFEWVGTAFGQQDRGWFAEQLLAFESGQSAGRGIDRDDAHGVVEDQHAVVGQAEQLAAEQLNGVGRLASTVRQ